MLPLGQIKSEKKILKVRSGMSLEKRKVI